MPALFARVVIDLPLRSRGQVSTPASSLLQSSRLCATDYKSVILASSGLLAAPARRLRRPKIRNLVARHYLPGRLTVRGQTTLR